MERRRTEALRSRVCSVRVTRAGRPRVLCASVFVLYSAPQATGYATRFTGSLVGSVLGTLVYNQDKWGWGLEISTILFLNGLFPIVFILPFVWSLRDDPHPPAIGSKSAALKVGSGLMHLRSVRQLGLGVTGSCDLLFNLSLRMMPNLEK